MFKKKSRLLLMLSLLLVFGLILAACGGTTEEPAVEEPAAEEPMAEEPMAEEPMAEEPMAEEPMAEEPMAEEPMAEEPMAEEPAERKVATFIWTQEFDSLSPLYTNMWFSTITQELWNTAGWIYDVNNEPVPVLLTEMPSAENGGVSEDGLVITMHLRDDTVWSDGDPLDAADFVFTYEMIVDPNNIVNSTYPYDLLESVEAPDDRTVVMTFAEPFVPWMSQLWSALLPEHILRPVFEAEGTLDNAAWNSAPTVGAGPYVFTEWESGSFARFVASDNYWLGKPKIDEIFIQFVPDDASQLAALQAGDGDLGTFFAYPDVPVLQDAGVNVVMVDSGWYEGWFPNLGEANHPAMHDVRVRQALAMALDRNKISQDLLLGLTTPGETLWDNTPFVDPAIQPWKYDPAAAMALLDEAGWVDSNGDGVRDKDGVELILTHGTTIKEVRQDVQAIVQQQLAEIGVQLDIQSLEADILFAGYGDDGPCTNGELDICEWSDQTSFPDPDHYYWLCSEIPTDEYPDGTNWQFICDEELDALLQAQASEVDPAKREEMFHQISSLMHENIYWLSIYRDMDIWGLNSRVQNAKLSGPNPFYNIMEWDLGS